MIQDDPNLSLAQTEVTAASALLIQENPVLVIHKETWWRNPNVMGITWHHES